MDEDPRYLTEQVITYIGNKRALLPFIGQGLDRVRSRLGKDRLVTLDLFSGSGIVSRFLKRYSEHVITNDLEAYSTITNKCYLANEEDVDRRMLEEMVGRLSRETVENLSPGFMTKLYAPKDEERISPGDRVFYTRRNAMFLDTARQLMAQEEKSLMPFLLGPLLSEASIRTNTSGVFKGFYKANGVGQFGGAGKNALSRILSEISWNTPLYSRFHSSFEVHQEEAGVLVGKLPEVDVAYLDPPYNQHPYGSNYFMLNLLVDYQEPQELSKVSGIPKGWNKSRYNVKASAADALFFVVRECKAKFILISYNSEGFIKYEEFISALKEMGKVTSLETRYNTFRGSRNLGNRSIHVKEYLFLLEKE